MNTILVILELDVLKIQLIKERNAEDFIHYQMAQKQ